MQRRDTAPVEATTGNETARTEHPPQGQDTPSTKSSLSDPRRKSQGLKRESPFQLSENKLQPSENKTSATASDCPPQPQAFKRYLSIGGSITPQSDGNATTKATETKRSKPKAKRLSQPNINDAETPSRRISSQRHPPAPTSKWRPTIPSSDEIDATISPHIVPEIFGQDPDILPKPSILKPSKTFSAEDSGLKQFAMEGEPSADMRVPTPDSKSASSRPSSEAVLAPRQRMISIAEHVVTMEGNKISGATFKDSRLSTSSSEDDEEATKIREEFKRLKNLLLVSIAVNSVFGGVTNFFLGPAMASRLFKMGSAASLKEMSSLQWCLVNIPAVLTTSACSLGYVTYAGIFSWHSEATKRAERDAMERNAEKKKELGTYSFADGTLWYVLSALGLFYSGWLYATASSEFTTLPPLCGVVLLLSVLPRQKGHRFWCSGRRLLDSDAVRGSVSWTLLLFCGSGSLLSQMAVRHNLFQAVFENVDAAFWKDQSTVTIQLLISFLAAFFAEVISSLPLCDLLLPIVVEIASVSTTNPVLYAIPVVAAASTNLIFPLSIPVVIMRNSVEMPITESVAVGLALKVVLVVCVVLSTNTLGRLMFTSEGIHSVASSEHTAAYNVTNVSTLV
ncbi:uncharacterized protein LOC144180448 isoform X1 [Haemaphysalis longicornis]